MQHVGPLRYNTAELGEQLGLPSKAIVATVVVANRDIFSHGFALVLNKGLAAVHAREDDGWCILGGRRSVVLNQRDLLA